MVNTLRWFTNMDSFEEMPHLNGVHGRVFMHSQPHPQIAIHGPQIWDV